MAKRKKNKENDYIAPATIWKGVKIILLLLVGYGLGWNFGYISGEEDGRSQARSSSGSSSDTDTSSQTDDYGRSPGHPHYGHNHS